MSSFSEIFSLILFYVLFFGLPIAATVWFIVSLILFLKTPKDNPEKRKKRKTMFIISLIIFLTFLLALIGIFSFLAMAISHM